MRDLLRFARPQSGEGHVDLTQVVERAVGLIRYSPELGQVEIHGEGLERPIEVVGDAGRLEQVLFNLLLNAGAAMGGRGHVHVRARLLDSPAAVELSVADVERDDVAQRVGGVCRGGKRQRGRKENERG